jgi:hypothetical protein
MTVPYYFFIPWVKAENKGKGAAGEGGGGLRDVCHESGGSYHGRGRESKKGRKELALDRNKKEGRKTEREGLNKSHRNAGWV